jgi:hypothetical protein
MTGKDIQSQYITETREAAPLLIRMWGKVVVYVNEQIQEHMVKLCKQLYKGCSDGSYVLGSYVRTIKKTGRVCTVDRKTTAAVQVLCGQLDYLTALGRSTDNRTAALTAQHLGSQAWKRVEATESHALEEEYLQMVAELRAAQAGAAAPDGDAADVDDE